MKGYQLLSYMVRYINILYSCIHSRLQSSQSLCQLTPRIFRNFLTYDFERNRGNTKNQPATIGIQKRTCRMHGILQLARRLFQFDLSSLIA